MNQRKYILIGWLVIYTIATAFLFIYLTYRKNTLFNQRDLELMIVGSPSNLLKRSDLCKVQLLGDPKVGLDYVKVNFFCGDGSFSKNTLALVAIKDKSVDGVIDEYGRIVNFDGQLSQSTFWTCSLNDKPITPLLHRSQIMSASTINCQQNAK